MGSIGSTALGLGATFVAHGNQGHGPLSESRKRNSATGTTLRPDQDTPVEPATVTLFLLTYNQEEYVREAVRAALAQDFSPLEIILSDDCSTDGTFEIMREEVEAYDGPHTVRLNRNPENLGITEHLNLSFRMATGELVVFAAGDDISRSDRVTLFHRAFEDGRPPMICSDVQTISLTGEEKGGPYGPTVDLSTLSWRSTRTGIEGILGAACAWSAEVFRVFGPIEETVAYEDQVMISRALMIGSIVRIVEPTVWYRQGGVSNRQGKDADQMAALKLRKVNSRIAVMRQRVKDCQTAKPTAVRFIRRMEKKVVELEAQAARTAALPDIASAPSPRWSVITVPRVVDQRGDLTVVEGGSDVPFDIARVYYLYNVPVNAERGGHAHRRLRQVIFALSGSFRLRLDDGVRTEDVTMRDPAQGLLIEPFAWREIDQFSQGAVLMVLASEVYDEAEYIRDYSEFEQIVDARAAEGLS